MAQKGLNKSQAAELRAVFNSYDLDGDGHVTADELVDAMKCVKCVATKEKAKLLIAKYDKDGSGTMEFEEFKAMMEFQIKIGNIFDKFDTDESGCLSLEEMKSYLRSLKIEQEEFDEIIAEFDKDKDNKITRREFIQHMDKLRTEEDAEQCL